MSKTFSVTAFYKFLPIAAASLESLQQQLTVFGKVHRMGGLVLLAKEGINGTVCGSVESIDQWKKLLTESVGGLEYKDSEASTMVFRRWSVKLRPEIVALRQEGISPGGEHKHLTPEEWNKMLESDDVVVLDTRNTYETEIGMFEGAVDPQLTSFQEFPDYVKRAGIPKDKKVLMYCTGGIRCEKALLAMEKQGYEHVYQLKGGILAYIKKFPRGKFDGECFVFDHRVAVDQELQPSSRYSLCPHCGDPGDCHVTCLRCQKASVICTKCNATEACRTCSKRCRNEYAMQYSLV
jgi:UPF0176 protein